MKIAVLGTGIVGQAVAGRLAGLGHELSIGTRAVSILALTAAGVDPRRLADGDHTALVSGDDAEAKKTVIGLLESFGHTEVIDLGDLSTARGTEMLVPVWVRLWAR
jgi:predicted dinucleotide-binding enzyme